MEIISVKLKPYIEFTAGIWSPLGKIVGNGGKPNTYTMGGYPSSCVEIYKPRDFELPINSNYGKYR